MKKRVLAMLLAVCMVFSMLPVIALAEGETSGKCGDNLTWTYDEATKTLTISGTGAMWWYDYGQKPWAKLPFETAVMEHGVTTISDYAFENCYLLTAVTIPDSVTDIDTCAFSGCTSLTTVTIPASVTAIGWRAFEGCTSLTAVTIPDSVTTIAGFAFKGCTSLTAVTIPDSVTTIGEYAFSGCTSLTAFQVDEANPSYSSDSQGVLYNKEKTTLIQAPGAIKTCTIPDSVTTIGYPAFEGCTSLTAVTIPDSVTTIEESAFEGCTSLTAVTIPDSVTTIGLCAFSGCTSLTAFRVDEANPYFSNDGQGVLYNKEKTELVLAPGAIKICTIPDSVTTIGNYAFEGCTSLTAVTIPASVADIGRGAFWRCTSLTAVTIPDSVTYIHGFTFSGCTSLTAVTIPDSVTKIDMQAFYGCYLLTDVYYGGTEEQKAAINVFQDANGYLLNATWYYNVKQFPDVPQNKYYTVPVLWATATGITTGMSDGGFAPLNECTRGQVVTFLWRAAGKPEPKNIDSGFSDVPTDKYFSKAVAWAVENGITTGMSNGLFEPGSTVTRAQFVTFLWRAMGKPEPQSINTKFTDVPGDKFYTKAVAWAVENGITTGMTKTTFEPQGVCIRGQVVTFLYRAYHG